LYNVDKGSTVHGPCKCDEILIRDILSHIKSKFNLPIWLTEFNCGNGYWKCPQNEHEEFMPKILPILEEMPWVQRYNWFSALTEGWGVQS